jgi:hypothetical protein
MSLQELNDIDLFGSNEPLEPSENEEETTSELEDTDDTSSEDDIEDNTEVDEESDEESGDLSEPDDSEEGVSTITELAEQLEVDPAELYSLQVPMGNGVEPLTLSELKDKYQEMARSREQFEAEKAQLAQEAERIKLEATQLSQVDERIQQADVELKHINETYNSIDWDLFEKENPGEAALQRQKFQEAFQEVSARKAQLMQQVELERAQAEEKFLQEQAQQVLKLIPEWKDREVYQKEKSEVQTLLQEYGFSDSDIQSIRDAKAIKLLTDYLRLKKGVSNAAVKTTKLRKSKILKPGSLSNTKKANEKKLASKLKAAAKSRNNREKAAVINELLDL